MWGIVGSRYVRKGYAKGLDVIEIVIEILEILL